MKIRVAYTVTLKPHEWEGIVNLSREWGNDYDKPSERKLVFRALKDCGVSGCLSDIPCEPGPLRCKD